MKKLIAKKTKSQNEIGLQVRINQKWRKW